MVLYFLGNCEFKYKSGKKHVQLLICENNKLRINLNDANFVIVLRERIQRM